MKAPFAYYGGKGKLIDWISSHAPKAKQFVDLFGGSGVVGLAMVGDYRKIVYNDIDTRLWNFFRVLRERGDELIDLLESTPASRREYEYCAERSTDPIEDARRVFVRISQSFSNVGLSRKTSGCWMTQSRATQSLARVMLRRVDGLAEVREALRGWTLENLDWSDVVRRYDGEHTLFFADPPYDLSARSGGRGYANEMSESDHRRLAQALAGAQGSAMVCGYRSALYDELYADWNRHERKVTCSNSAGKTGGMGNSERVECLWIKCEPRLL